MDICLERSADRKDTSERLHTLLEFGYLTDREPAVMVHDTQKLRTRIGRLKNAFPASTLHSLAIKSNPLLAILKGVAAEGFGLEAASSGEVELALAAGCSGQHIVYDSPAKTRLEIERALELGLVFNANSESEVRRVVALGSPLRFGLRCNPLVGKEATTMVATADSKFGVPLNLVPALLDEFEMVNGLHVHVGSQLAKTEDLVLAAVRVMEVAQQYPQIEWLDLGGGLPTRYRQSDTGLTPEQYWAALSEELPELQEYTLITEIGRALQANCGWAVSRVEYAQAGRCVLHVGADLFLRECYQPETWWHDIEVFDGRGQPKTGPMVETDIFGPLCFSGDRIAKRRLLPKVEEGDLVVIHDCGAYTLGMWSRYCSRRLPAVVGFEGENLRVLKEAESASDLVTFWS